MAMASDDNKSCLLDKETIEKLLEDRYKEENLKEISTFSLDSHETEVHVMTGKSMKDVLESVKSIEGDSVSPIKIIIHGIEVSEDSVDVINSFKNDLKTDNITFKNAEKSCLILFADIKYKMLQDDTLFVQEVNWLIRNVFRLCKLQCKPDKQINAVVTSAEEEFDRDHLDDKEEGGPNLFGNEDNLVLHVEIQNKALLSNETMGQVCTEFLDTVVKTGNGKQFIGKKSVHAVLVPEEEGYNERTLEVVNRRTMEENNRGRLKGKLEEARQESLSFQEKIIFNWKLIKKNLTAVDIVDSFISEELVNAEIGEYIKNESHRSQMDSLLSNVIKHINTTDDFAKFEKVMTTHNIELQTPIVELTIPGNKRTEDHLRVNRKLIEKELYPKDLIDSFLEWFIISPEDHEGLRSKENVRQHMAYLFLAKIMKPHSIEKGSMTRLLESFQRDQNCILMHLSKLMDSVLQNGISHIFDDNDLQALTKKREDCRNVLLCEWTYLSDNFYPYSILIDELHNGGLVDEDRADVIQEKPRREQVYLILRNIIRRIDGPEKLSTLISILKKEKSFIAEKLSERSKQKEVIIPKQYDFRQLSGSDINNAQVILHYNKDDIVKELYATDMTHVTYVDTFVESLVFNVDDHEIICETGNGYKNKAQRFYEQISDTECITRGSLECLIFCLENNKNLTERGQQLKELLLSREIPDQVINRTMVAVTVSDGVLNRQNNGILTEAVMKMLINDEDIKEQVESEIVRILESAAYKYKAIDYLPLIVKETTKSSVLIHLESNGRNVKCEVEKAIENGDLTRFIDDIFGNENIKMHLSPGKKYKVSVSLCSTNSLESLSVTPLLTGDIDDHKLRIIKANREMLEEEYDALPLLNAVSDGNIKRYKSIGNLSPKLASIFRNQLSEIRNEPERRKRVQQFLDIAEDTIDADKLWDFIEDTANAFSVKKLRDDFHNLKAESNNKGNSAESSEKDIIFKGVYEVWITQKDVKSLESMILEERKKKDTIKTEPEDDIRRRQEVDERERQLEDEMKRREDEVIKREKEVDERKRQLDDDMKRRLEDVKKQEKEVAEQERQLEDDMKRRLEEVTAREQEVYQQKSQLEEQ